MPSGATGTVTFYDGASVLGTGTLDNGSATLAANLAEGTHTITAVYAGDATRAGSTSVPIVVTVASAASARAFAC